MGGAALREGSPFRPCEIGKEEEEDLELGGVRPWLGRGRLIGMRLAGRGGGWEVGGGG